MRKIAWLTLALLVLFTPAALAWDNLNGAALVDDDGIYYAGSLDGRTPGVFRMNPDGSDARTLLDANALLLAASDQAVLALEYDTPRLVLLSEAGQELLSLDASLSRAFEEDGVFYAGNLAISLSDGKAAAKLLFEAEQDQLDRIEPLAAEDGYLYFLDNRDFIGVGLEEDAYRVNALKRVPLDGGAVQSLTGGGVQWLGMENGRIFYLLRNYYVVQGEDVLEAPVEEGLYSANPDGSDAVGLASLDAGGEQRSLDYSMMDDDVLYGLAVDFTGHTDPPETTLKRLTLDGKPLPDVQAPYGHLAAEDEGLLYFCQSVYAEMDGESVQCDQIIVLDPQTGAQSPVGNWTRRALLYSEAAPKLAIEGGRIAFTEYNAEGNAIQLRSIALDGTDERLLGRGISWND